MFSCLGTLGAQVSPRSARTAPRLAPLACALGAAACTASAEDVRPPPDQLFFPTGLAASPDERNLFVTNANSELRYDSGSIGVIAIETVQSVIAGWETTQTSPDGCSRDPDHSETLICDEAQFFRKDAGVRIGNFATDIAVQDFTGGILRVIVPTRGDPSIAWADFYSDRLHCTQDADTYALCDDAHRLTSIQNNPDLGIPSEPFSVFAGTGFAMVTHLSNGVVSLVRAPSDSNQVEVVDVQPGNFQIDVTTGLRSATGVAGLRRPAPGMTLSQAPVESVYVASSTDSRVQTFSIGDRDSETAYLLPGPYFFLTAVGSGGGHDARGMQFSPTGDRLYIVNRAPPSIQIYDTSVTQTGVVRNAPVGASDICRAGSTVAVLDTVGPAGTEERAYVTCFQDGQIYVIDPSGQSQVEDIISVGRGPFAAVAISGMQDAPGKQLLFVSNFLEDTIAVVDVSPSSPNRNRVVLRIGNPRAP